MYSLLKYYLCDRVPILNLKAMKIKTLDGNEIDLNQDTIVSLKMRLRGQVLTPVDIGYEESRTVWNGMIDKKPAIIVRCLGTADVIACMQFVREHNLLVCIKGGGHNIAVGNSRRCGDA
jgi:hypothetical protein